MSQNKCQTKTKTATPNTSNKPNFESEILHLAPCIAYINLAISGLGTTYRAYANNDTSMMAFIALVVLGYLLLELCFRALQRLPRASAADKECLAKRAALKIAIWSLSSAILFGFAYQISTFSGLPATLFIFSVVGASSACIFFVYFIYDDKQGRTDVCDSNNYEKIATEDKRVESVLEKV